MENNQQTPNNQVPPPSGQMPPNNSGMPYNQLPPQGNQNFTGKTKLCRKCSTRMNANAKICPNCRQKQPNPTIRIIIIVVAAICFIGFIGNLMEDTPTETTTNDKGAVTETASSDATEIYYLKLHEKNADYLGKNVKFSAPIAATSYNGFSVTEGIDGLTGQISVELQDEAKADTLKEGEYITVAGKADDKTLGVLTITNAIIVETGDSAKKSMSTQKKAWEKEKAAAAKQAEKDKKSKAASDKKNAAKNKKAYITSCKSYGYKKLARYPDKYKGKKITVKVKVEQILEGGLFDDSKYYRCYTKGDYDLWMENEFFIVDKRESNATKILQGDVLTVYGEYAGCEQVERALSGTNEDVPAINMKYCKIK